MHILPCEQVRVMRRFIFSQFSPIKHQIFLVYTPVDSILITQNKVHVATKPCLQHLLGFCPLFFSGNPGLAASKFPSATLFTEQSPNGASHVRAVVARDSSTQLEQGTPKCTITRFFARSKETNSSLSVGHGQGCKAIYNQNRTCILFY